MSWLARLDIDVEAAYAAGILGNYDWHKRLWECYPDAAEAKRDFLTRIDHLERSFRIWIMGKRKPLRPQWCSAAGFAVKEIAPSFFNHRHYVFDLRANPVKAVLQRGPQGEPLLGPKGKRKRGKRVPLVRPEDLRAWLTRKGEVRRRDEATGRDVGGGFRVMDERPLEITRAVQTYFSKNGKEAYHSAVQFRGTLEVTDRARFVESYHAGLGGAKGFGFGLLLLAPVRLAAHHTY